ncbi:hypothetical protein FRB95_012704 [Tulasnella sp. JGI-2019a]|nr:hypothetical protein FRB93_013141 [Tulasnella sp. JGI-2019a]KAG9034754.1 hypothetical protein FRB95_012704 [Tulasnella sp. JGI-2019a]
MSHQPVDLIIQDTANKGKGLFSSTPITQGTCIISEDPIVTFPASDEDQVIPTVEKLSPEDREKFLAFGYAPTDTSLHLYRRIVKTNAVPMYERKQGGIFEMICRANHDCRPNAMFSWDDGLGKEGE